MNNTIKENAKEIILQYLKNKKIREITIEKNAVQDWLHLTFSDENKERAMHISSKGWIVFAYYVSDFLKTEDTKDIAKEFFAKLKPLAENQKIVRLKQQQDELKSSLDKVTKELEKYGKE